MGLLASNVKLVRSRAWRSRHTANWKIDVYLFLFYNSKKHQFHI